MGSVANALPGVPDVESPLFETVFTRKNVSSETMRVARDLRENGFAVIDFPDPEFNAIAARIIEVLSPQYNWEAWRAGKQRDLRVQDAWANVPEVKRIASNPAILDLLRDLYGRRAFPFQTLNFAVGTQQHYHSDSIHFSSCPERFMVGVWVALEDIDAESGPLVYYPGSHKLPIFTNEQLGVLPDWSGTNPHSHYPRYEQAWEALVEALDLKPMYFHAKKGQALIWSANLLHGGAAQRDKRRTRWSQVTHYYFEDCCYYTPLGSVPFLDTIHFRNNIVDISTGEYMRNRLVGAEIPEKRSAPMTVTGTLKQIARRVRNAAQRQGPQPTLPPGFDAHAYLQANPDVAASGADPVRHWIQFGQYEGRRLR